MYIARRVINDSLHFKIAHSFKKGKWWRNEDLVDLGEDPARFISAAGGGYGFEIQETIREELYRCGIQPGPGELEKIFLPFAPAPLRGKNRKTRRGDRAGHRSRLPGTERSRLTEEIALFDRRRLHYLVWGEFDLSAIGILPIELFLQLADKSRDEIEQDLLQREQLLAPEEYSRYIFSAFNLQTYFIYLETGAVAPGQERDGLDQVFFEELCLINSSSWYWMEDKPPDRFHPHLSRYVVMFLDYDPEPEVSWRDYLREHERRPPAFRTGRSALAEELFGITGEELLNLSDQDLHILYKKRAKVLHPDHGGDQEQFIRLQQTYESILKGREQMG
jgi:hypothetical protein